MYARMVTSPCGARSRPTLIVWLVLFRLMPPCVQLAARREKARKLAEENKQVLEQQIKSRIIPPPEVDVASLQMTQAEKALNMATFKKAMETLSPQRRV